MSKISENKNTEENLLNNFTTKKQIPINEELENKLSSELDGLIIDNKKKSNIHSKQEQLMLDNIIQKLHPIQTSERKSRFEEEKTKEFNILTTKNILTHEEIKFLCIKSLEIFMEEPVLLEISAPVNICGDTHGQFNDLLNYSNSEEDRLKLIIYFWGIM